MRNVRLSHPADIPAQRLLWKLAFGDDGEYVDNFYTTYYRPERVLVLEEDGIIRCMTAWFDTSLVLPEQGAYRLAYLYAVATHPDCRGRGMAAELLARADKYFHAAGISAVSTVPAQPSLHLFFQRNGFAECFTHSQQEWTAIAKNTAPAPALALQTLQSEEYGWLRETLLAAVPHVVYPQDALAYQAGCCRLSGGGLYEIETPAGPVALCAEGLADGTLMLKELLGQPQAQELALHALKDLLPRFGGVYRVPGVGMKFGMMKWLDAGMNLRWNWGDSAYLGLAFD